MVVNKEEIFDDECSVDEKKIKISDEAIKKSI